MRVTVVKKAKNLDAAREELALCSLLENRVNNDFSLEYKDSTGKLWELNVTPIDNVRVPEPLRHKLRPERYSVAFQTPNGWANTDGPFIELKEALDVTPNQANSVILLLKGDQAEFPVYAYDDDAETWRALK